MLTPPRRAIDAHVHIWDLPGSVDAPLPHGPATRDALLAAMDAAGVIRAVLVQPSLYGQDHDYLRAAVAAHPARFAAVARLDPFSPDAISRLDDLDTTLPVRGVRFRLKHGAADEAVASPIVQTLLERLARNRRTLTVLTSPDELAATARLARRHPDLRVVVDHLGSPERGALTEEAYRRGLDDLRATPNVWLKLSGFYAMSTEVWPHLDCAPLVRHVLDAFGPDRLVWGSDFPFSCAREPYAATVAQLDRLLPDLSAWDTDHLLFQTANSLWW